MANRTLRRGAVLLSACILAVQSACWNGVNDSTIFEGGGGRRFSLVIEPNRTDVEATHFLVDTFTGDVWRLDAAKSRPGKWLRLTSGPEDVSELPGSGDAQGSADPDA